MPMIETKTRYYIRFIMLELTRIASHPLWLGPFMGDVGLQTPLFYTLRDREPIYEKLITHNPIFRRRTEGVGVLSRENAVNWGIFGPMLRASGVKWDLRRVDHYECYDDFDWEVQWETAGDSLARY